ncbi:MAG: MotA/TolQ/ExbB proton channel family protein [Phycisphaerales bacterium]
MDQIFAIFRAGGWVMYPLLALSVVSLALIVERLIYWGRGAGGANRFALYLADLQNGNLKAAMARSQEDRTPVGRLVRMLASGGSSRPSEGVAFAAIETLRTPIERWSSLLGVIVAAAPLLGILGTVTGIIESFDLLGAATTISDPTVVAGGIAEALYTTAFGLTIALVTVLPHAVFRANTERTLSRLEAIAGALSNEGSVT